MAVSGVVKDDAGKFLGKYLWIQKGDQELLDSFCKAWLETYKSDSRFFLTIDLETQGLDYITQEILLFSISWDGKNALIFDPHYFDLTLLLEVLRTIPVNNTNTKFDAKFIYYRYKVEFYIYFDAMVAAQLGWPVIFPKHKGTQYSLDNMARQLLDIKVSKDVREGFIGKEIGTEYTIEQIEYAVKDSIITHQLVYPIMKRLHNENLLQIWEDIERPLLQAMVRSEVRGVLIDVPTLKRIYQEKEVELLEIFNQIETEVKKLPAAALELSPKGKFNPGSYKQVLHVMGVAGVKLRSTEAAVLEETLLVTNNELLRLIVKYKKVKDEISKFLKAMLEKYINPVTSCIHPNYLTNGTATGRLACVGRDTEVETSQGLKKITELEPNKDWVKTHTGKFQPVQALIYKGLDELFEVELENGSKIICTKEHKFLTENGWESLGNLESSSILDIELISYEQT